MKHTVYRKVISTPHRVYKVIQKIPMEKCYFTLQKLLKYLSPKISLKILYKLLIKGHNQFIFLRNSDDQSNLK